MVTRCAVQKLRIAGLIHNLVRMHSQSIELRPATDVLKLMPDMACCAPTGHPIIGGAEAQVLPAAHPVSLTQQQLH